MEKYNLKENICKDLEKSNEDFFIKNFTNILSRIEEVEKTINKETNNRDILIILKEIYDDIVENKVGDSFYQNRYENEIKRLVVIIEGYFKKSGYDSKKFNNTILSDGTNYCNIDEKLVTLSNIHSNKNKIAALLIELAIALIVLCIFSGIIFLKVSVAGSIFIILSGCISALFIFAIAENIKILHDIRKKLYEDK